MGVSLPKDWAKAAGIEPGATVLVVKEDDGLTDVEGALPVEEAGIVILQHPPGGALAARFSEDNPVHAGSRRPVGLADVVGHQGQVLPQGLTIIIHIILYI